MDDNVLVWKDRSAGPSALTGAGWIDYIGGSSKRKDSIISSTIDTGDHYGEEGSNYGVLKIHTPFPSRINVSVSILDMQIPQKEINKRLKRLWEELIPVVSKLYEE